MLKVGNNRMLLCISTGFVCFVCFAVGVVRRPSKLTQIPVLVQTRVKCLQSSGVGSWETGGRTPLVKG